jgi:hypothetical protein
MDCSSACVCPVNPVGRPTLCDYLGPGCFSEYFFVALWAWFLLFVWLVVSLVTLFFVIFGILVEFGTTFYQLLTLLLIPLAVSFLFWFFYPQLAAPIRDVVFPVINVLIEIVVIAWNLFIILWNLFVRIWNALCQLIGLFLYMVGFLFLLMNSTDSKKGL